MSEVLWDVALTRSGKPIWIDGEIIEQLYCPECDGKMTPVRGQQRQHHFRHDAESNCSGESAKHRSKKYEIADVLGEIGSVMVEGKIGNYVADVLFENEWAFEVVFSNPPSEEKLNDLRDNLVVFNFADERIWDEDDNPIGPFFDYDDQSFNGIVSSLGKSIVSGETVDVCSVCREVKGLNSRISPGATCYDCFFSLEIQDELKRKKEWADRYREAKMR